MSVNCIKTSHSYLSKHINKYWSIKYIGSEKVTGR